MWASTPDDAWIAGGTGTLLHWDGSAFALATSGSTEYFAGMWGTPGAIRIVGAEGIVLRGP